MPWPPRIFATLLKATYSSMSGRAAHAVDEREDRCRRAPDRGPRRSGRHSHSAMSSTGASFSRRRPGSPWMPMPTSTSSSGRSKVGVPAAGTTHDVSARPIDRPWSLTFVAVAATSASEPPGFRVGAGDLLEQHGDADAAPAGRVQRVLDRDVVVGDDRRDLDLARDELGRELEVQHVAGVVLDDVEDAGAAVDGPRRGLHLIGDGRGEHVARRGRVEHAEARRTRRGAARGRSRRRRSAPTLPCFGPPARRTRFWPCRS